MRRAFRNGILAVAALGLSGCTAALVERLPRTATAPPSLRHLPPGTWGVVITEQAVRAGSLRVAEDHVRVDTTAIPFSRIRCLGYRYPPGYRPPTWVYAESYFAAGIWGLHGLLTLTAIGGTFPSVRNNPASAFLLPLMSTVFYGIFATDAVLFRRARSHPRWMTTTSHPFVFVSTSDDPWVERCAEFLHFYAPLLSQHRSGVFPFPERSP